MSNEATIKTVDLLRFPKKNTYHPMSQNTFDSFIRKQTKKMLDFRYISADHIKPKLPDKVCIGASILLFDAHEKIPFEPIDFIIQTRLSVTYEHQHVVHPSISKQFYSTPDGKEKSQTPCPVEIINKYIIIPYQHPQGFNGEAEAIAAKAWLEEISRIGEQIQQIVAELFPVITHEGKEIRGIHPSVLTSLVDPQPVDYE